jgi:FAD/FMN-containing dehydrogenase
MLPAFREDGRVRDLADALADVVGREHVLVDPETRAGYERDWTGRFGGPSAFVVRPGSTEEVSSVLLACAERSVPVIPQGGNTGLVGGGVPGKHDSRADRSHWPSPPAIISLSRISTLEPVDTASSQVTAGAGVTLAALQAAAASAGLAFAVDLAARDSATVGGMVATNAGGLHVMRHGAMRSQVLGLEAVLADGRVISRLDGLVKDNTGYDLSQLLVGSEGTLAVVTAARLRLVPAMHEQVVALLGFPGTEEALVALALLRRRADGLQAAELFYDDGLELVCSHAGIPRPLVHRWGAYLLVECASMNDPADGLLEALESLDLPDDATALATDAPSRARLWAYRELHSETVSSKGVPHKLDVTLPQGRLARFEAAVREVVERAAPRSTLVLFGHAGDGNLHVNVVGPDPDDESVDDAILRLVISMGGSISAEHGIGRAKSKPWRLFLNPKIPRQGPCY